MKNSAPDSDSSKAETTKPAPEGKQVKPAKGAPENAPVRKAMDSPTGWAYWRRRYRGLPPQWAQRLSQYRQWLLISGLAFLAVAAICTVMLVIYANDYPWANPHEAPALMEARALFQEDPSAANTEMFRELEYVQRKEFFLRQHRLNGLAVVLLFSSIFGLVELKVWSDVRPGKLATKKTGAKPSKDKDDTKPAPAPSSDTKEAPPERQANDKGQPSAEPSEETAAPAPLKTTSPAAQEFETDFIDDLLQVHGKTQSALIPALNAIQAKYRYLPEPLIDHLQKTLDLTRSHVDGVISFYHQYRLKPCGKKLVRVCIGTACHVAGAPRIIDQLHRHYGIPKTEDTSDDQFVTIEEVACMGCCMLAPAATVEEKMLAKTNAVTIQDQVAVHGKEGKTGKRLADGYEPEKIDRTFALCHCSSCEASGSREVEAALKEEIAVRKLPALVEETICAGESSLSPMVHVRENGNEITRYNNVSPRQAAGLLRQQFPARDAMEKAKFWWEDITASMAHEPGEERIPVPSTIAVHKHNGATQKHIAAANATEISPLSLESYRNSGGFDALTRAIEDKTPEKVIDEILESGLRGRGGAGFPTGIKWKSVREHAKEPLVVCNGDEGDPGAFMDRLLLENFPFRVLEGMALAAYAVGAEEGVLYIRAEYPLAIRRIEAAIKQCEQAGLLGDKLGGTDQAFRVRVISGAGAFVCGEETALLASLEGNRGEPRQRPPFPAESGAWGRSTLINNVESFCNVPWILRNGATAFKHASASEDRSAGTKTFALAGKVKRPGLIEVPVGTTLREIVEEIGGGVPDGKQLKAVQIGGPSGGCVPASQLDVPIDYDTLQASGSMMGSGGMVVLDEDDCMVDVARYFMDFARRESCGKCAPCRIGTLRMFELLTKLCEGRANKKDLAELESLAQSTKTLSLCGLGKTAPNPLISTLQHFREEYEAHLNKECPAGVCPDLIAYEIIPDDCVGCTLCREGCPVDAITGEAYENHVIDVDLCIRCDACRQVCPEDAVIVVSAKAKEKPKAKPAAKPAAKPTATAKSSSQPKAEKKEAATADKG